MLYNPTENTYIQFFRSLFVGGIATVFDFGITALVREVAFSTESNLFNIISCAAGFIIGLLVNFTLSCMFIFSKTKYGRTGEFFCFSVIGIIGLLINIGIIYLLGIIGFKTGILFYTAKIIATLITLFWNFGVRKFLLYRSDALVKNNE